MVRQLRRISPLFLFLTALLFICALGVSAVDNAGGPPPDIPEGMSGPPGGGPGGMPGVPPGMFRAPSEATIYIENGVQNTEKEYEAGKYKANIKSDTDGITIQGLNLTSGDYTFDGIVVDGEKSIVTIDNCKMKLGVTTEAAVDDTGGTALITINGATTHIKNSQLVLDGAQRYTTYTAGTSKLIVNDSSVTQTGSNEFTTKQTEPFSNNALLISGIARANMSVSSSKTNYFNSTCTTEGWAALSTDMASPEGLDLYAYNTRAIAQNGGYGTYADFDCRVWLYGSTLESPEIGAIISKSGKILIADGASAPGDVTKYNTGKTTTAGSVVMGGRNAVMIHAPDMSGVGKAAADCGFLDVINSTLATSKKLKSTRDYAKHINKAVDAYINYTMGAALLVKSTSAVINFDNAKFDTFSGIAIMTILNSDSMGNFLKAENDGAEVKPVAISMKNMEVKGDIKHMDYQRIMTLSLENATLNGAVVSGTMEEWNSLWTAYDKEECNWLVDGYYNTRYGVKMTLKKGTTWNVSGLSTLSSLTVENGGKINGTVQVDGITVTPAAGKTYTGNIVVKPICEKEVIVS